MKYEQNFTIGFFRGEENLSHGGIAPYAVRLSKLLQLHKFTSGIALKILSTGDLVQKTKSSILNRVAARIDDSLQVLLKPGPAESRIKPRSPAPLSILNEIDILHVPFQTPPTYEIPYICTMHDVQELHFPEYFSAAERERRAIQYRKSIENAVHIVVSYEHVRQDVLNFFDRDENDVSVLPLPLPNCQLPEPTDTEADRFRAKYHSLGEYFLYPAQTWKHKNHLRLIEAFEQCCDSSERNIHLVCTGAKNEHFSEIQKRLSSSPFYNRIHFIGLVSETELQWLYKNSVAVVIPTLYEAGSFPLIEAMLLEAPAVCSNVTSLPATISDSRFTFDPYASRSIYNVMNKLLSDSHYRNDCKRNSTLRKTYLLQQDTISAYEKLWNRILENGLHRRYRRPKQ